MSVLLFKPEHVPLILAGSKTQTRRLWTRPRAKVGGVHNLYTRPAFVKPPGESFARVKVLRVWREPLGSISNDDARREGYSNAAAFLAAFDRINGATPRTTMVWCVEFALLNEGNDD